MMRSRRAVVLRTLALVSFLLLPPATPAASAPAGLLVALTAGGVDPEVLIQRLVELGREADFVGYEQTTVFRPVRYSSRQKVTQKDGARRILYLYPPGLKGKEIYIEGPLVIFDDQATVAPGIPLGKDLRQLRKQALPNDRVAGRPTSVVEVRPARSGDSRRIWIDAEKWVPLRWEDRNRAGALLSRTTYTSIEFSSDLPPIPPPAPAPKALPQQMSLKEAEKLAGFRASIPTYLPRGYRRQVVTVTTIGKGQRLAHSISMRFSNGLDILTLFQAPARAIEDAPRPGQFRVSSFGQLVWVRGDLHYVLEAPASLSRDELMKIARSVK